MRNVTLLLLFLLLLAACENGSEPSDETPVALPPDTPTPQIGVTLVTRAPATAAVIQTTPTPLPTSTPTPTATPVVYQIEEGDTLLGIAIQNYTTVEEIESLNPGIVAELLQIGQQIVLPPPATPVFSGVQPTAVPLQISVREVQLARTSVGSMWILGEIVNEGEYPAAGVKVQVELLGAGGESLLSVPAWIVPAIVRPQEQAPFAVLVQEPPAAQVQAAVAVVGGDALLQTGTYYLDLAVAAPEATIEGGQVSLAGTVENVGQHPAAQVAVVATFYDAQRSVTGYAQQLLEGPLAPGETMSFALDAAPPGGPTVDYTVSSYGVIQQ